MRYAQNIPEKSRLWKPTHLIRFYRVVVLESVDVVKMATDESGYVSLRQSTSGSTCGDAHEEMYTPVRTLGKGAFGEAVLYRKTEVKLQKSAVVNLLHFPFCQSTIVMDTFLFCKG